MTAFVILAAGRGSRIGRVGESLHKALVPLNGKAVLSHLFDLAPPDAHIIVCLGHRAEQIIEYVRLAHPTRDVTFVTVDGWDKPGGGPGYSLLQAREVAGDDAMVFTSCDTLWERDVSLWDDDVSWSAVAPVPSGTPQARWCRMMRDKGGVVIADKCPTPTGGFAYTGLSRIARDDLDTFWAGLSDGNAVEGELQVSGGLKAIASKLTLRHVHWTDVGDAAAYARAVALVTGYDWTKLDEATYVLPAEQRVVKFWTDHTVRDRRMQRGKHLADVVPQLHEVGIEMLAYEYIDGVTLYEAATEVGEAVIPKLLNWAYDKLWTPMLVDRETQRTVCMRFYHDKTMQRIEMLEPSLRLRATDAASRVDWSDLVAGCKPSRIHGDFNYGNIMLRRGGIGNFVGIDWRGDFGGEIDWGDQRYDLAKLLAGMRVHWDNARRGDFRPWPEGRKHEKALLHWIDADVQRIAALSLINSAPLHASPLDEILVSRGTAWLEECT